MSTREPPQYPHLGVGWAFPPRWFSDEAVTPDGPIRTNGHVALSDDDEHIRESIELILRTDPGSRRMRFEFGAGVSRYVFAPRTADTCFRLAFEVERALLRWEPRIIVDKVLAEPAGSAEDRIDVHIEYRTDSHRRPTSLVLPFYLETAPT